MLGPASYNTREATRTSHAGGPAYSIAGKHDAPIDSEGPAPGSYDLGRESERAHFVLLSDQGHSPDEIGELMGYAVNTVKMWLSRYAKLDELGLEDQPRSGRPVVERHLKDILETQAAQSPTSYGYIQTLWTVGLLVIHLANRFRVHISTSSVRRALRALGRASPSMKTE